LTAESGLNRTSAHEALIGNASMVELFSESRENGSRLRATNGRNHDSEKSPSKGHLAAARPLAR
jgi:hypothetical protein